MRQPLPGDAATVDFIARSARVLYGERWQSPLIRALAVKPHTVRQWLARDREIPAEIIESVRGLVAAKERALTKLVSRAEAISPMTQAEFAARLKALGRGRRWFARECGVTESWVYRLGTDRPFPAWVGMLLDAWERIKTLEGEIPG